MAIKEAGFEVEQTGVTSASPAADGTILLRPRVGCSIIMALTSGSPSTGAKLQVSNSSESRIKAGTAIWADHDVSKLVSTPYVSAAGEGVEMTGVRLVVTDGTWTLSVRQK